jgi:eukaryotic-like serine/threonine-protein kinase
MLPLAPVPASPWGRPVRRRDAYARVLTVAERLLDDRYRLKSVVGRGGMAEVWRAVDERLGRPVAVKVLDRAGMTDPFVIARFDREARTVARLTHPNVVTVHDVGLDNGVPYLVMELVEGRSLAELLADGPLDVGQTVRIAREACDALDVARAAGIVHRDVKPANILITSAGTVKVCDFGIAHGPHGAQVGLTGPATAVGTSEYMAPEQVEGGQVDHRTDLYALGCVLYAMLTGHPPFTGDTPLRVLWRHVNEAPTPVRAIDPAIPSDLSALVGELLAKDPADRPATAAEVRARLSQPERRTETPPRTVTLQPTAALPVQSAGTAARPSQPVRARAAVLSPTHAMPVLDVADVPPTTRGRFRLGPAGIAGVAVAVAVVVGIAVAAFTSGGSGPQAAPPTTAPPAAVSTPATVASAPPSDTAEPNTPQQAIANVRSAIQAQVQAGQLDGDLAHDLTSQLDDIEQQLSDGNGHKAAAKVAGKVDDLRTKLRDAQHDGKITAAGYSAIAPTIDQLAASLPARNDNQD